MKGPAATQYEKLANGPREQFLKRAQHNALMTIPSLVPLDGHTQDSHLMEANQGFGAQGVSHLSARIANNMLPAGRGHMRFDLPPAEKMKNQGEEDDDVTKLLGIAEQLVTAEVEGAGWRDTANQSVQQLMVAGNVLENVLPNNVVRLFRLDQYVVRRDHAGRELEIIVEERFDDDGLPADLRKLTGSTTPAPKGGVSKGSPEHKYHCLYSWIKWDADRGIYTFEQEFLGKTVKGTEKDYDKGEVLNWRALRWMAIPGEDYGRSYIEELSPYLRTLEGLEKSLVEQSAMAARNFVVVRPGALAVGLKNKISRAYNGDVVIADPDAMELKSFENVAGFQIVAQYHERLTGQLSRAFLLLSAGQRDAERVTAREISRDIQEVESVLGGIFTNLSRNMLGWRTEVLIQQMQRDEKLPKWEEGAVTPQILTGLEALSREQDVFRAEQIAGIIQTLGPQAIHSIKIPKVVGRAVTGLGMPDAVRTESEAQAEQQRVAELEALQQGVGAALGRGALGGEAEGEA